MYKVLILGCGNIGAGYDFDNDQVLTHAKAFNLHPEFSCVFYDQDHALSKRVAEKYDAMQLTSLDNILFSNFDCVSICTPTETHAYYLNRALASNVPLILCEKPVASDINDIKILLEKYKKSSSKVIVNYMRRFLPCYKNLRHRIIEIRKSEELTNVSIRYMRGFMNNAGHALDLISFLTDSPLKLQSVQIGKPIFDVFPNDPTLSLNGEWDGFKLNVNGLTNVKFSCFEIDLFFEYQRVMIRDAGKVIQFSVAAVGDEFSRPLIIKTETERKDCLKDYMIPVVKMVHDLLTGTHTKDNFREAVYLNIEMLKQLKT